MALASVTFLWLGLGPTPAYAADTFGAATDPTAEPASTAATAEEPKPPAPQSGLHIGRISIEPGDVFDLDHPGERKWLFRWANRLHRETRSEVILRQLLFAEGDPLSTSALAESERALRRQRFLVDASVTASAPHDGVVDVDVRTRDSWSLEPGVGFKRTGGTNTFHFNLHEANLLGLGKDLAVELRSDVDRTSRLLTYSDPNLLGSRYRLDVSYSANSDGSERRLALEQPFFALTTRRAEGLQAFDDEFVVSRYALGHVRDRFRERQQFGEAWFGLSRGLEDGATHRLQLGLTYDDRTFFAASGEPATILPGNRRLVYPWIRWSWVQDRFVVERDVDRIDRPEDVAVGWQASARTGFASSALGSDRNAVVVDGALARAFRPSSRQLIFGTAAFAGRLEERGADPASLTLGLRYLLRDLPHQALAASFELGLAHALDAEQQLLLGGDSGLRGYPLRYQEGDRRMLFSLEHRWYGDRELLHLFRLGAAVFADAGRAWFSTGDLPDSRGWLKDFGIGLRFAPSRSAHANVVRLDIAFPVDRDPAIDRVQILVSTSERF
ncbi:MAG: BamA/TamA family outer membrane protein [Thermoanaerobaculia bacterium]